MGRIRLLKQEKCTECDKIGVWAKGLCHAHYSKMRRNTPEGKLIMQTYNKTKGKIAQKKFRDKKPKKEPIVKKLCECGKISIAKNLCRNCYQKKRYNENYTYIPKERKVIDFTPSFLKVLAKVKKGFTISESCKLEKIDRTVFYRKITEEQKIEINLYKALNKKHKPNYNIL